MCFQSRTLLSLDLHDAASQPTMVYLNGVLLDAGLAKSDDNAGLNDDFRGDLLYVEPVSAPAEDAPLRPTNGPFFSRSLAAEDQDPAEAAAVSRGRLQWRAGLLLLVPLL